MKRNRKNLAYAICYLAYASIYIARLNLSMASPELKARGVLDTAEIGLLGTAFSVTYALGRLYNGMRSDVEEPRKMIVTGLLLCGLANLLFGLFPPFWGILLLWVLNAFAQSMLWSSVLRVVNHLYKKDGDLLTKRLSTMVSAVASGNIAGILVAMFLIAGPGVRWAFLIPGFLTLLMGALLFCTVPLLEEEKIKPEGVRSGAEKEGRTKACGNASGTDFSGSASKAGISRIFMLLKDREIRTAAIPSVCHGVMKDNVTLWMAVYFVDTYAIDIASSAGYVLFIPLVGLAARLFYPVALRLCKNNEHRVSMLSFGGCLLSSLVLIFVRNPLAAVVALSLVYAFTSLVNSSMLSIFPARFEKKGCMASVGGLMDFCNYFGAAAGSFVFGHTIDSLGYGFMFALWAAVSVLSLPVLRKLNAPEKPNRFT